MSRQWKRRASLVVAQGSDGLDLSQLRFTFSVRQADIQTPNVATIRVYNLSDQTSQSVQKEFSRVILQCGYEGGAFGVIFDGTIKQVRRGREDAITSYIDILAGDGDAGLNFAILNASLAGGSTPTERIQAASGAMAPYDVGVGYLPDVEGPTLPRGKVLYGMSRDELRAQSSAAGLTYSIQNGKLVFLPLNGFKPGEAVVLNAQTGMIGWPEQTDAGIRVKCLINPQLEIGAKLQLDNKSILQALQNPSLQGQLDFANLQASVSLNDDGLYRIYVIEHTGDTRGNDWYSDIVCLSVDGTVPMGLASKGQG